MLRSSDGHATHHDPRATRLEPQGRPAADRLSYRAPADGRARGECDRAALRWCRRARRGPVDDDAGIGAQRLDLRSAGHVHRDDHPGLARSDGFGHLPGRRRQYRGLCQSCGRGASRRLHGEHADRGHPHDHRRVRRERDLRGKHVDRGDAGGEPRRHDGSPRRVGRPIGERADRDLYRDGDSDRTGVRHSDGDGELRGWRRHDHWMRGEGRCVSGHRHLRRGVCRTGIALDHRHLQRRRQLRGIDVRNV